MSQISFPILTAERSQDATNRAKAPQLAHYRRAEAHIYPRWQADRQHLYALRSPI